jgi:hypothetical protein
MVLVAGRPGVLVPAHAGWLVVLVGRGHGWPGMAGRDHGWPAAMYSNASNISKQQIFSTI